jgi:hypothetical protein
LAKRLTRVETLPPYGVDPPPTSANFSPERQRIFIAVLAQCGSMHTLGKFPVMSMITRIVLENGVKLEPGLTNLRRALFDRVLDSLRTEMFTAADISAYG